MILFSSRRRRFTFVAHRAQLLTAVLIAVAATAATFAPSPAEAIFSNRNASPLATTSAQPNADPVYQELRNVTPGGKSIEVKDVVLKRDAGKFTFRAGTFYFLAPVKDLVTGAIFIGDATFSLTPPIEIERKNLQLLTKSDEMVEEFSEAVFR